MNDTRKILLIVEERLACTFFVFDVFQMQSKTHRFIPDAKHVVLVVRIWTIPNASHCLSITKSSYLAYVNHGVIGFFGGKGAGPCCHCLSLGQWLTYSVCVSHTPNTFLKMLICVWDTSNA